jgi:hypothetical protein
MNTLNMEQELAALHITGRARIPIPHSQPESSLSDPTHRVLDSVL